MTCGLNQATSTHSPTPPPPPPPLPSDTLIADAVSREHAIASGPNSVAGRRRVLSPVDRDWVSRAPGHFPAMTEKPVSSGSAFGYGERQRGREGGS
ncbi:hypothetical protein NL676_030171 [Syzygium grande]|nr:hypothetical protein NL676_030171 [Syzygium grande]